MLEMDPKNAIEVRDVKKYFKFYPDKGKTLKEKMIFFKRNRYEKREVLKGISFDVAKGEAVGLIGKNGCGKSTTLKILTRILYPNGGTVAMRGRVSSLIELGAGFHADMTGRENIYINASIFGLTKAEIDSRIDGIIRFSELEEFIDTPVRTYSSGMYMRLAFSVAINVDADILLIDEILAVGDGAFQTKCFNKLKQLKDSGCTIVIVSHSLGQIEQICDRCFWIDMGLIRSHGPTRKVVAEYTEAMEKRRIERAKKEAQEILEQIKKREEIEKAERKKAEAERAAAAAAEKKQLALNATCWQTSSQCCAEAHRATNGRGKITKVLVTNSAGKPCLTFGSFDDIFVDIDYELEEEQDINFGTVFSTTGYVFCGGASVRMISNAPAKGKKKGHARVCIKSSHLSQGKYYLDVIMNDFATRKDIDRLYSISIIQIKNPPEVVTAGIHVFEYDWTVDGEAYESK